MHAKEPFQWHSESQETRKPWRWHEREEECMGCCIKKWWQCGERGVMAKKYPVCKPATQRLEKKKKRQKRNRTDRIHEKLLIARCFSKTGALHVYTIWEAVVLPSTPTAPFLWKLKALTRLSVGATLVAACKHILHLPKRPVYLVHLLDIISAQYISILDERATNKLS